MSGSAYLDAIAGAYPPAYAGPAGNQVIQAGKAYSYSDVQGVIQQARSLALANLVGPTYDVAMASHVLTAMQAARDAVARALGQAAAAYSGDIRSQLTDAQSAVKKRYDTVFTTYAREVATAISFRESVVALTIWPTTAADVPYLSFDQALDRGVPPASDFGGNVAWYMNDLSDTVTGLGQFEALMESYGSFGLIGQAVQLVVDALSGVWGIAQALGAAFANIGALVPIALYGGGALLAYWGAKKVGLLKAA